MSADAITVTVEGEPVTREVSWEQVRAYLRAKEWDVALPGRTAERWDRGSWWVWIGVDCEIGSVVGKIARYEQRHPSAVLRDIARGAEPAGVEALSPADLTRMEQDGVEVTPEVVLRLLATVRARERTIATKVGGLLNELSVTETKARRVAEQLMLERDEARAERDAALKNAEALRTAAADMLGELALNPQAAEAVSMLHRKLNAPEGT